MMFVVFSGNVLNFAQALVFSVKICLPMYVCTSKILVIIVLFISCAMLFFYTEWDKFLQQLWVVKRYNKVSYFINGLIGVYPL